MIRPEIGKFYRVFSDSALETPLSDAKCLRINKKDGETYLYITNLESEDYNHEVSKAEFADLFQELLDMFFDIDDTLFNE